MIGWMVYVPSGLCVIDSSLSCIFWTSSWKAFIIAISFTRFGYMLGLYGPAIGFATEEEETWVFCFLRADSSLSSKEADQSLLSTT